MDPETQYLHDKIKPYIQKEKLRGNPRKLVKADLINLINDTLDEVFNLPSKKDQRLVCSNCGHMDEVHGEDCQGFKFSEDGKSFSTCHCKQFEVYKKEEEKNQ